ncbi:MAG: hypothetical protein J2P21_33080 [Chloracidobacterium sp.]|nr:hypothetical protein [Chloracidobacterium sp.]
MKYLRITIALAAVIFALALQARAQPGTRKFFGHLSRAEGLFDAKGVKLHYIVEGEGEPVVLIHGLRSSARISWQTPGIISLLSKKYKPSP